MLPRPELPRYKITLPFSGKEYEYRPYNSKEEKILMMAASSGIESDMIEATHQVLKLCIDGIEPRTLAPVDLEWAFLKLRSTSVSNIIDVQVTTDCEEASCPPYGKQSINIDLVTVEGMDFINQNFKKNKKGWIIPFTESIGIVINPIDNVDDLESDDYIWECLSMIYNNDDVIAKEDFDKDEFFEWINLFTRKLKEKLEIFFNSSPYTYYKLEHTCENCNKKYTVELKNILDFFE